MKAGITKKLFIVFFTLLMPIVFGICGTTSNVSLPEGGEFMGGTFTRHPLYLVADKLKEAFYKLGFQFADNGEGFEIEETNVSFATWEEPAPFDWQKDPIPFANGKAVLRTRILPAQLRGLKQQEPVRLAVFGRVYNKNDVKYPMHSQIEGFVVDRGLTQKSIQQIWDHYAVTLFGLRSSVSLEPAGSNSFKMIIRNAADGNVYDLGYTGPASDEALRTSGINAAEYSGWVFVIDVDQFALQFLSLADRSVFYENDVNFLSRFATNDPAAGYTPEYRVTDTLRQMGYMETCTNSIYPDGIYVKMNMIQEAWDTNNVGFLLARPLGDLTAMRTVLTPATEETLALNFTKGAEDVRIFEVSHIFSPEEGKILPRERYTIGIGAYGPNVTLDSFTKDIEAVLKSFGISYMFVPTDVAIAYKTDECLLVLDTTGKYLDGNFGRINEIAARNFGIGVPAYMANLELPALVQASRTPVAPR
jgi:hypothetical protein